jgi:hypothetical protein
MPCRKGFGYLQGVAFMGKFLKFQSHFQTQKPFWVDLKQICSEKNASDSYGPVFVRIEICFLLFFGENVKRPFFHVLLVKRVQVLIWGFQRKKKSLKRSFYLYE